MSTPHAFDAEGGLPARSTARAGWITGGVLLLALAVLAARYGESERFLELARQARPLWLGAGLALQATTYACAAGVWQRSLHHSGRTVRLRDLLPLGLAKLFADQALPSAGLSGTALVLRSLSGRGVPRGLAIAAMLVGLVSFYAAYAIAVTVAAIAGIHVLAADGARFVDRQTRDATTSGRVVMSGTAASSA